MANGRFRAACIATLFMSAVFFASLLYLPQFFQKILSYSPLEAGLRYLPLTVMTFFVSAATGASWTPAPVPCSYPKRSRINSASRTIASARKCLRCSACSLA